MSTKTHIARGDADEAARRAVAIGRLCTEAHLKELWESHALRGEANASVLKAAADRGNQKKQSRAETSRMTWQAMTDEMRARNPHLGKAAVGRLIAGKTGDNPDTVRRRIKLK